MSLQKFYFDHVSQSIPLVQRHACSNWTLFDYIYEALEEDEFDEYMEKMFYEEKLDPEQLEVSHRDRGEMTAEDELELKKSFAAVMQ